MNFLKPLRVELQDDGRNWIVLEEFDYEIGEVGGEKIVVPMGVKTDFGSVPQFLWGLISPIGKATRPFVLHDYLYSRQLYSRGMADFILLEALGVVGEAWTKRRAIYYGVRVGGWVAWGQHKKRIAAEKEKLK